MSYLLHITTPPPLPPAPRDAKGRGRTVAVKMTLGFRENLNRLIAGVLLLIIYNNFQISKNS